MKQCPRCGSHCFCVSAHVVQDWLVDGDGNFLKSISDCVEVTHFPDDDDLWQCNTCGYDAAGKGLNVKEPQQRADQSLPVRNRKVRCNNREER